MELAHAFFAKYAEVGENGIFSLVGGGFDSAAVESFPAFMTPLAIIAGFKPEAAEIGQEQLVRVQLFNPDGQPSVVETEVRVTPAPDPIRPNGAGFVNCAFMIFGVPFGGPGRHEFRIYLNGRQIKALPFDVIHRPAVGG